MCIIQKPGAMLLAASGEKNQTRTSHGLTINQITMKKNSDIKLFEDKKVGILWDEELEKWYLSIVDVIEILTGTDRPRKYWSDLKAKLQKEGSQLSEKIGQLKMAAEDGKMRMTDVADAEQLQINTIYSISQSRAI